jgi:alpha-methylacyl-CoA racemase
MTRSMFAAGTWQDRREANLLDGGAPNYRCYACSDGRYVAVGALEPRFWQVLVETLGLDPARTASPHDRREWPALTELLGAIFATKSRDDWAAIFAPLDACVAPVLSLAEAPAHPHNAGRDSYIEVGGATVAAPAPRFSDTPATAGEPVARGADTEALLAELGYDEAGVAALRESGAIG